MPASQGASQPALPEQCTHLYQKVCGRSGKVLDPTGWVKPDGDGEIEASEMYAKIVNGHSDWNADQVAEEFVNEVYTPQRQKRLRSAFEWVRDRLTSFLQSQPQTVLSANEKAILINRVHKVQFQLPVPASVYADEADVLTKSDVYYEQLSDDTLRLRMGGGYLMTARSWFNYIFTFAHELAHSIDPCELRHALRISVPAFDHLTACLMDRKVITFRNTRRECGQDDQLAEAFADWIAVQISSQALAKYAREFDSQQMMHAVVNSVRDLCDAENDWNETDTTFHPSAQTRIEQLFGNNKKVSEIMGCNQNREVASERMEPCGFNWTPPTSIAK